MLSNITVPLVSVVDVAMIGRLYVPAFIDDYWIWVTMVPLASVLAFQKNGVFVRATSGKVIRNAMLIASASFAATILLIPFDLMVLIGSFVGYVALRGISCAVQSVMCIKWQIH